MQLSGSCYSERGLKPPAIAVAGSVWSAYPALDVGGIHRTSTSETCCRLSQRTCLGFLGHMVEKIRQEKDELFAFTH